MKEATRLLFGIFLYAASFVAPAAGVVVLLGVPPDPPYTAYAGVVLSILVGGGCTYWLLGTRLWHWVETGEWKRTHGPV